MTCPYSPSMGEKTSNGRATVDPRVEGFISRWQGREGGQERANCRRVSARNEIN